MKTVVLDNYREVAQTISYEDDLVVIDRKKPPLPTRTFFAFVILLCLGIIGEYLAKIYTEVKRRPVYLIGESHLAEDSEGSSGEAGK